MKPTYELQIRSLVNKRRWIVIDKSSSFRKEEDAAIFHSLDYFTRVVEVNGKKRKVVFRADMKTGSNMTGCSRASRTGNTTKISSLPNGSRFYIRVMTPNPNCQKDLKEVYNLVLRSSVVERSMAMMGYLFETYDTREAVLIPFRYMRVTSSWLKLVSSLRKEMSDEKSKPVRERLEFALMRACGLLNKGNVTGHDNDHKNEISDKVMRHLLRRRETPRERKRAGHK